MCRLCRLCTLCRLCRKCIIYRICRICKICKICRICRICKICKIWKVIDWGAPFTPVTGRCNLCTKEKFYILRKPEMASLNSRQEVGNHSLSSHRHVSPLKCWESESTRIDQLSVCSILSFCVHSTSFVS